MDTSAKFMSLLGQSLGFQRLLLDLVYTSTVELAFLLDFENLIKSGRQRTVHPVIYHVLSSMFSRVREWAFQHAK